MIVVNVIQFLAWKEDLRHVAYPNLVTEPQKMQNRVISEKKGHIWNVLPRRTSLPVCVFLVNNLTRKREKDWNTIKSTDIELLWSIFKNCFATTIALPSVWKNGVCISRFVQAAIAQNATMIRCCLCRFSERYWACFWAQFWAHFCKLYFETYEARLNKSCHAISLTSAKHTTKQSLTKTCLTSSRIL